MKFVFNLVYLLLLTVLSPWIAWRIVVQGKNRRGWKQKLFGMGPVRCGNNNGGKPCVWIHAVSVGEVNLLGPLLSEIDKRYPNFEIAISTTTETGFDLATRQFADRIVFFCPADFSWAVANTISRLQPNLLLLTELELWPNLISVAKSRGVNVGLINGRVSEKSFRGYHRLKILVSRLLNKLSVACVQTESYAERLRQLGMEPSRIQVCGNMKFDCVCPSTIGNGSDAGQASRLAVLAQAAGIESNQQVFLAGSTQEHEDKLAIEVYEKLKPQYPELRLVLVPRHPDRCGRLASYLSSKGLSFSLRSQLNRQSNSQVEQLPAGPVGLERSIVVVDVIGELRDWWNLASVGYVGGSMGTRGGQNMIEPASCGVPICFGPNTENFRDVVEQLLDANAARVVTDADELLSFVKTSLDDLSIANAMGDRAKQIVQTQVGATDRTIECLSPLLPGPDVSNHPRTNAA